MRAGHAHRALLTYSSASCLRACEPSVSQAMQDAMQSVKQLAECFFLQATAQRHILPPTCKAPYASWFMDVQSRVLPPLAHGTACMCGDCIGEIAGWNGSVRGLLVGATCEECAQSCGQHERGAYTAYTALQRKREKEGKVCTLYENSTI